jgi:hypothetical protein
MNATLDAPEVLLLMPYKATQLRLRYQGGDGRGKVELELRDHLAARVDGESDCDWLRLEEAALRLLDAFRPGWTLRPGSGSLLIDAESGDAKIELDGAG